MMVSPAPLSLFRCADASHNFAPTLCSLPFLAFCCILPLVAPQPLHSTPCSPPTSSCATCGRGSFVALLAPALCEAYLSAYRCAVRVSPLCCFDAPFAAARHARRRARRARCAVRVGRVCMGMAVVCVCGAPCAVCSRVWGCCWLGGPRVRPCENLLLYY